MSAFLFRSNSSSNVRSRTAGRRVDLATAWNKLNMAQKTMLWIFLVVSLFEAIYMSVSHHYFLLAQPVDVFVTRPSDWRATTSLPQPTKASRPEFHIVFSTGCSAFQDWQSYGVFYHILKSGQSGNVTRVASGCSDKDARLLDQAFGKEIRPMSDRFHLHQTPEYARVLQGTDYKFFNKPYGLAHWFDNGLEYKKNKDQIDDVIFVILDPDEFILRPFLQDYSEAREVWVEPIITRAVVHGKPMSQKYGLGASWARNINMTEILGSSTLPSTVRTWTNSDIVNHYVAGPPYLATGRDMYRIVQTWKRFAIPVYQQTKDHLSEMFAYSVAAGHLVLPHQLLWSFMDSNVFVEEEGWPLTDNWKDPCGNSTSPLPHVMHFCQVYFLGPYFFSKYALPKDFLSCNHPLLVEPGSDIMNYNTSTTLDGKNHILKPIHAHRSAFSLCRMTRMMNEVATYFKQQHCPAEGTNYERTYNWGRPTPMQGR